MSPTCLRGCVRGKRPADGNGFLKLLTAKHSLKALGRSAWVRVSLVQALRRLLPYRAVSLRIDSQACRFDSVDGALGLLAKHCLELALEGEARRRFGVLIASGAER